MFDGSSNSFTEICSGTSPFGFSRLEQTNSELNSKLVIIRLDFSEEEIGSSWIKLKRFFSNLRSFKSISIQLFPGKRLFKNALIEDWLQSFLDFNLLFECDGSLYFLFALK